MTPVHSANLAAVGYNPVTGTLTIEFRTGRIYNYSRVPSSEHLGLMRAVVSHNAYFRAHILDRYPYRRTR